MVPAQRSTLSTQAKIASPAVRDSFDDSQEARLKTTAWY